MSLYFFLCYLIHFFLVSMVFSIYYHRGLAHKMLEFSKPFEHFCRFMLFTIGEGVNPFWSKFMVAEHRHHHRFSDSADDYTSIHQRSLLTIFKPDLNPRKNLFTWDHVEKYAPDITATDDWIQNNVYKKYRYLGMFLVACIYGIIFGFWYGVLGLFLTYFLNFLIPIFGAVLVHNIGYRNEANKNVDQSRNLFPFGFLMCGEELHSNHHNHPNRLNYAMRWFEIDIGYYLILLFVKLKLLKIRKITLNQKVY